MLPSKKQEYQVEQGDTFINDTSQYNWGALEALYCEKLTVNGHAWNNRGIKTNIQHLYIISDDKIAVGDQAIHECADGSWRLYGTMNIEKVEDANNDPQYFKVIATTRKDLFFQDYFSNGDEAGKERIPQPSKEFVDKYCELDGIDEIMVQYDRTRYPKDDGWEDVYRPHVSKDFTITIKAIGKPNYTKNELLEILEDYRKFVWKNGATKLDLKRFVEHHLS